MHCLLSELKEFLYCKCILATLLQNRAQYLKIFVLKKVLNFFLFVTPMANFVLTYYAPANWSFRRQILRTNYFIIIIYYEVFLYFLLNQFFQKIVFFAFWWKK